MTEKDRIVSLEIVLTASFGEDYNGVMDKLESLYMTKSLINRLYLK